MQLLRVSTFFNLVSVIFPSDPLRLRDGHRGALDVHVVPHHPPLLPAGGDLRTSGHEDLGGTGGDWRVAVHLRVAEVRPHRGVAHRHRQILILADDLKSVKSGDYRWQFVVLIIVMLGQM